MQQLLEGPVRVQDHLVFYLDRPIGVMNPGILFGVGEDDRRYIYGPLGKAALTSEDPQDVWAAIIGSGSLLFGTAEEARRVSAYLVNDRMSRTTSYFCSVSRNCSHVIEMLERINRSFVVILGCGGIGSIAAMLLAGAGVPRLRLVDPDSVEMSNLNRQIMWNSSDVGKIKVEVLRSRLLERFPELSIETHKEAVSENSLSMYVSDADAVLLTADDPIGLSVKAKQLAKEHHFILVTTGYLLRDAGITLSSSKYQCDGTITWTRGPFPVMPSFGPTNAELAGISSTALIHAISNLISYDDGLMAMNWDTTIFPRQY